LATKLSTSPETAASYEADSTGSACASPRRKDTCGFCTCLIAYSIYPSDESIPRTVCGDATSSIVWLRIPVPHPTSNHVAPDEISSDAINFRATSLLH
jgi:hypothetical protein